MFMEVERKKESNQNVAQHLLRILRKDFDMKLNMTDGEFSQFVHHAFEAVKMSKKRDWTYENSCDFVFAALTTIGKSVFSVYKYVTIQ